jgi:hypothetical protein
MKWSRLAKPIVVVAILCGIFTAAHYVRGTMAELTDSVSSDEQLFRSGFWVCTYTLGYWRNHPDAWPVEEITVGGVTYWKAEAISILETPSDDAVPYIIIKQLIAAKLNMLNGADPSAIEDTIPTADAWLEAHPLGSNPSDPERQEGIDLSEELDDYNNGVIGPGHCDDGDDDGCDEAGDDGDDDDEDGSGSCVHGLDYWRDQPDAWPIEWIVIGGETWHTEETLAILRTPPRGDATYILAHRLIAAKLNVAQGANPDSVAMTIDGADQWLVENPLGSVPRDPEREEGISLASTLDAYNAGHLGPPPCPD